jgi:FkbM family methyltransferase
LRSITPYVAAQHRDGVFLVPTLDRKARRFFQNGRPRQFVRLARAVRVLREAGRLSEGGVIVDVGAHIGTTSIMALIEHGFSEAVAIEPDPDNVRLLRASAALNEVGERIQVIPGALSDSGAKRFFVPGRKRGGWAEGRLTETPSGDAIRIEMVTLDDLAAEGIIDADSVRLIWCGHPVGGALVQSAASFLERRVPLVIAVSRRDEQARTFLRHVARYYDAAVDLRHDLDEPLSSWTPRVMSVERIAEMTFRRHTDVLVF